MERRRRPLCLARLLRHQSRYADFSHRPRISSNSTSTQTLDFGKEISGRIHLVSPSDRAVTVGISYGESAEEAVAHPYLGVRELTVPPHGEAYGPKSAFRYVHLTFPTDAHTTWTADAQGIAYPVEYKGAFESSDPLLNRIWETGAYTAHLCMQEGIWDGVKRDRGRWMGDLDVTGRVINSVFADRALMESTMAALIGDSPVQRDVNTIAGSSALWISGQANFYRHTGDLDYLRTQHQKLLELLRVMDAELDPSGLFTNPAGHKVFVDWSTGFSSDTPEARAATHLELYLAYQEASYLLTELGDSANAALTAPSPIACSRRAIPTPRLRHKHLRHPLADQRNRHSSPPPPRPPSSRPSGPTSSRRSSPGEQARPAPDLTITPYYGYYVLSAMARLNHRREALDWIRQYWGGMIAEGATSFWEAYDPRWPKKIFTRTSKPTAKPATTSRSRTVGPADPTAWLMEQVLGIEPTAAGFRTVTIRPDLADLEWAHGTEPTPHGPIAVNIRADHGSPNPATGTIASVSLPFAPNSGTINENGKVVAVVAAEEGERSLVTLSKPGEYNFTSKKGSN